MACHLTYIGLLFIYIIVFIVNNIIIVIRDSFRSIIVIVLSRLDCLWRAFRFINARRFTNCFFNKLCSFRCSWIYSVIIC